MCRYFYSILMLCVLVHSGLAAQQFSDSTINVYFDSGKFSPTLTETNRLLSALRGMHFTVKGISGYADSVGSAESNFILSRKRSENIIHLLGEHFTLAQKFTVQNYGEEHPVRHADNALNRRVELLLTVLKKQPEPADSGKRIVLKTFMLDKLYFRPDEPVLEPSSIPYLDHIAGMLKTYPNGRFEIRGHVNWNETGDPALDSGYREKMNALSTARAKLVYDILIGKGIPRGRMSYKGMGNTEMIYPFASNDEEKRKNMRVEILVVQ